MSTEFHATPPVVEARGVTLQYKTARRLVAATYGVDFAVLPAGRFVVLGRSGCGKSTLLKAVGGYRKPVEGEFRVKGRVVTHPGPDRMMVLQEFEQLLPWRSVKHYVMLPSSQRRTAVRAAQEKAMHDLAKVNLAKSQIACRTRA